MRSHSLIRIEYEALVADTGAVIDSIASFLNVELGDQLRQTVLEHAHYDWMKQHAEMFDYRWLDYAKPGSEFFVKGEGRPKLNNQQLLVLNKRLEDEGLAQYFK